MQNVRFVAEFTTNHLGNFNLLKRMIESASECGCSFIKMQKKDVSTFYSQEKLQTSFVSPYGKTYGEYRHIFEFDHEDFSKFNFHCQNLSIPWFATVQDRHSLDFLLAFNLDIYKLASLNIRNADLIDAITTEISKDKEIVVSTGGATFAEIEFVLNKLNKFKKITLLHCVAEYPCLPENLRLGNIPELLRLFSSPNVEIGYSGHEEGILPSIVAIGLGATMIERHFCVSRASFAHHIECSLEPDEYRELINVVAQARSKEELLDKASILPPDALAARFGMSEIEKAFLLEGKYGTKYLKEHSVIHGG
jgi:N-acetylneuraminate synthase